MQNQAQTISTAPGQLAGRYLLILIAVVMTCVMSGARADAQDADAVSSADSGAETVQVDWFEEMGEGGVTMIALGLLSVALGALVIERGVMLRRRRFVPAGLVGKLLPLGQRGDWAEVEKACRAQRSVLSRVVMFVAEHRGAPREELVEGAGDVAARELSDAEQRLSGIALIAGIAPLLGLLGTMIGMIEAFKLVEVFGDEGGASMLAGSISKALITTAAGLILAIPALIAHHIYKRKTQRITRELEEAIERLLNAWLLKPKAETQQTSPSAKPSTGTSAAPAMRPKVSPQDRETTASSAAP